MYNASATFNNLIKGSERLFIYSGSIETTAGDTYEFTGENIFSGKISRSISGQKLEIGTVYASELRIELALDVDRYELYNGVITLNIQLDGAPDVIPMGYYVISEVTQTTDRINIKAYDAMTKLDQVKFSALSNNTIQFPYAWLTTMCTACGVTLGMTEAQIKTLPNGDRKTGFADVVTDVKTWRDVLRYLGAYLGSFSYIGRDGKLYLGQYSSNSADTVPSSFRYTSNLSDYRTCYDGIYATYKDEGLQEYAGNENTGGIILDLGVNPFLQFTVESSRKNAIQEIIDSFNGIYYVPFDSDMPLIPTYDPGDVLTFTDNQAGEYDIGVISEVNVKIGGQMKVTCSGDNPLLTEAQDRFTKSVAGLNSDYSNGQEIGSKEFWLLHTENDEQISVGSTKTLIAQIDWDQKVDVQRMGFMFTCEAELSATATVSILITVDDSEDYEFEVEEEKSMKGKRPYTRTCGFRVVDKGEHSAKVYMTVTDNPTKWSDLV